MPITAMTDRQLTSREEDVLDLLAEGGSNKSIARSLGISEATVKMHVKNILAKVRLKNRTQAAVWATTHQGRRSHGSAAVPIIVERARLNGVEFDSFYQPTELEVGR
jgi:DNA-binding CsgD family transcriptional regulator